MNRRNLFILAFGVFVVLLLIVFLLPGSPSNDGPVLKVEEFFYVNNSIAYLDVFMLKSITLDEHYFYDEEHPPSIRLEVLIPDPEAWIIWHVVNMSEAAIQEVINSGEGFTKYVVENGSNGNYIAVAVEVTEPSEYMVVFRQTNLSVGTQPYDLKITVAYWGLE